MSRAVDIEALVGIVRRRDLRRLELAFVAFAFAEHATWLAVLVYALEQGGAREVGVVVVVQLLPGVFLAPLAAYAGDRFAPHRALAGGYGLQCLSMAVTAGAMWAGEPLLAYAGATMAATCITFTRPVMGAVLPTVTHSPSELIAANGVTGLLGQIGLFGGPLLAGLLMAVSTPATVFAVACVGAGTGAVLVLTIDPIERTRRAVSVGAVDVVSQALAGFAALGRDAALRALMWLIVCAGIVKGVGDVVVVTFAEDRLEGGGGQAGVLAGAYGLGAILGALGITRLARTGRVGRFFLLAAVLCCIAMLALAVSGALAPALLAFAMFGVGETLLDLTAIVTVQRRAPLDILARIFGVGEGLQMGAIAVGSLAVSVLTVSWSLGVALVSSALAMVAGVLLGVVALRRHDDDLPPVDDAVVDRLLADPVLAPLAAPTIERLAHAVERVTVPADSVVVSEGQSGDRYYLVCTGVASVTTEGRPLRELDEDDSFGEIALLRDVPRTATVRAISALTLLGVPRDDFLEAVTGSPRSLRTATTIIDDHLSR